jgi:hypothetical protein
MYFVAIATTESGAEARERERAKKNIGIISKITEPKKYQLALQSYRTCRISSTAAKKIACLQNLPTIRSVRPVLQILLALIN